MELIDSIGQPETDRQQHAHRREAHVRALWTEAKRLAAAAARTGAQRVVLFCSLARGEANLYSDLDMLIIWNTPLAFLDRTVEMYRCLQPRLDTDLLVYTPDEIERMAHRSLVKTALTEGRVLYET